MSCPVNLRLALRKLESCLSGNTMGVILMGLGSLINGKDLGDLGGSPMGAETEMPAPKKMQIWWGLPPLQPPPGNQEDACSSAQTKGLVWEAAKYVLTTAPPNCLFTSGVTPHLWWRSALPMHTWSFSNRKTHRRKERHRGAEKKDLIPSPSSPQTLSFSILSV